VVYTTSPFLLPILLLIGSNVFMTLAWYGHLRFKEVPLVSVILVSWGIAFVEYCMAVPANRWGVRSIRPPSSRPSRRSSRSWSLQASPSYLKEPMTWNCVVGFALVAAGAYFIFRGPL
jgi:uncharacterized protein